MNFIRKNTLFLSMLISTSLCSSNAMDGDIGQPEETPTSIIRSQDLEYCISLHTDLIKKDKKIAELQDSLEKAKMNFETTGQQLENFPENIKIKALYRQHLKEFSYAKSDYIEHYNTLIIQFQQLCSKEGFANLSSQFIEEDIKLKKEVSALAPVAIKSIDGLFKKAWALVDSYKMDTSASENKEGARKLFKKLIGLHPYAAQGLAHCAKEEVEAALLESVGWKLDVREETGLLGDLELLSRYQNMRDVNLLLRSAQYYRNKFNESKNPIMIYNAIHIGTMMPKCQEGTLLLNQIASLDIVANGKFQDLPYWVQERQSFTDKQICYKFMNFCRNQEDIQCLNIFLTNNNFEGEWWSDKDQQFFARQLKAMQNDKNFWLHPANLNVLKEISNSSRYPEETRVLAAKIRLDSTKKKSFDTYFDYYKILKQFDRVERHKYIGILHVIADGNIQTHPEQLYKFATELGYFPETLPMFINAADAGHKEAMSAIETHDIFLTDGHLESLALFFARHNSVKGLRSLYEKYNKDAFLVIIRGLEERSQPLATLDITEEYLPLLDLKYEEYKAEIKELEKHISKLEEMIQSVNLAPTDFYDSNRLVVTYYYRPTIADAHATEKNIQKDLSASKIKLEKNQNWIKMYAFKRQELIESIPAENLFSLAKDSLLIYQALNTRLRDGQEKTKILKDTYFELLKTAAQNSQEAAKELKDIETNGFGWPLYVLPSEAFHLEELEEFKELNKSIKERFMTQLDSHKPLLISFSKQQRS